MEAEFKLPDTLDFSLSFPPYSHFLSFYLSMPESVASLMQKKNQAIDSLSDTGYSFEYVPMPLAAEGFGMYVKDCLNYTVIERTLWIDIQFFGRPNIICRIIYRKHNSPQGFQDDFDEALERIGPSNKSVFIMGHVTST